MLTHAQYREHIRDASSDQQMQSESDGFKDITHKLKRKEETKMEDKT